MSVSLWEKGMVGCVFTIIHLLVFFASLPHCGWATPHKSNKLHFTCSGFFFFLYMMVSFTSILISNLFCLNRRGLIRVKFILAKVIMWNTCSVVSNKHLSSTNLFALKGNQNFIDTLKPLM